MNPAPTFRERLTPPLPVLVVAALLGAALGLVVYPFAPTVGYVVAAGGAVGAVVALLATAPVVVVDGGTLRAGRAQVPARYLGVPEVLDPAGLRRALGVDADARAYVCHAPWARGAVRVPLVDPQDPTPYWLVASRRPDELAQALRA